MTKQTLRLGRVLAAALVAGATLSLSACVMAAARGGERAEQMKQKFDKADTDGDGYISRDEAQKGLPRIAEHFDDADTNHDGKLSKDEIAAYLRSMRGSR